ncbi:MAG TPA: MarR family transcriptional regulator [Gaiellaceae bacterium]|nr:MarR family transcriptional regulator [Gaiellaceae bacterium]
MPANRYSKGAVFRAELRRFLRRSESCARQHGLTPRQYLLLLQIGGAEGSTTTVSELVSILALSQSAITELVQRAESAGLVRRTPSSSDGRVSELTLTPLGAEKLAIVHDALGPERAELRRVMDQLEEA